MKPSEVLQEAKPVRDVQTEIQARADELTKKEAELAHAVSNVRN